MRRSNAIVLHLRSPLSTDSMMMVHVTHLQVVLIIQTGSTAGHKGLSRLRISNPRTHERIPTSETRRKLWDNNRFLPLSFRRCSLEASYLNRPRFQLSQERASEMYCDEGAGDYCHVPPCLPLGRCRDAHQRLLRSVSLRHPFLRKIVTATLSILG